jgi:N-acetylmuramoyl-L-alanine amidase
MKRRDFLGLASAMAGGGVLVACGGDGSGGIAMPIGAVPATPPIPGRWSDLRIDRSLMIPAGKYARHKTRRLRPRYITIHATDNFSRGAGARAHASGLHRGSHTATYNSLGYLSWHFTIDDSTIYQSLPCNEQGQHADYEGKGNTQSIGVEMCVNRDGNLKRTLDRSARFAAVLMKTYGVPLGGIVPHYHWPRTRYKDGKVLGHKACPSILMTNGKPGPKWDAFVSKVGSYRRRLG